MGASVTKIIGVWFVIVLFSLLQLRGAWADPAPTSTPLTTFSNSSASARPGPSVTPPRGPAGLPTEDELQQLVDDGKYAQAIPQLDRVIALKGDPAKAYDRFHVIMLKVECRLQMHAKVPTDVALKQATEEAYANHNIDDLGEVSALQLLIRAAHLEVYTPSTGTTEPKPKFNILTKADRDSAAPYLFADTFSEIKQEGWQAKAQDSITPLLDIASRFAGVRALEKKTTQKTVQTDVLGVQYARTSTTLIEGYLNRYEKEMANMKRRANQMVQVQVSVRNGRTVRQGVREQAQGPSKDDITELNNIISTCQQIPDALNQLTEGFARPVVLNDKGIPDSADVLQDARELLSDFKNWSSTSHEDTTDDEQTPTANTGGATITPRRLR